MTDEQAIQRIVRELEAAWNAGDAAAFAASFTDDADFVNILGDRFRGRSVIQAGHTNILRSIYKGSRLIYTLEQCRQPRPDVMIAHVHCRLMSSLGSAVDDPNRAKRVPGPLAEAQSRMTLFLVKESGSWRIAAIHSTKVASHS